MIEMSGNSASAGTKVPASRRLLSVMVIPSERETAPSVFISHIGNNARPSQTNAKANLWNQTEQTFMLRCGQELALHAEWQVR
jgi:hypothetical protein